MSDGRDSNGRFVVGNPGGPGRPRRAVEADYLVALAEIVTLDAWRSVVRRALADAEQGDAKAREWLSKHVAEKAPSLEHLAWEEKRIADEEERQAEREARFREVYRKCGEAAAAEV